MTALQSALEDAVAAHPVPGAVVGTLRDGLVEVAATGVLDMRTGEPMTPDTAFLTGSITKVWATVLALTLVQEGALDLDAEITHYLPGFRFGREQRFSRRITVRQLLNHSSGTDAGDLLVDTGEYPAGVKAYLDLLAGVGHLHAPGRYASYNNAGWLVLEAVLRRITGKRFDELLRERVIEPLGADRTGMHLRGEAPPGTAIGHFPDPAHGEAFVPTPEFLMPGSLAAAGTNLLTTAGDTLRLLQAQLPGATARLLSPVSAAQMCRPTIADPSGPETGFALGWRYRRRGAVDVLWHGGGSYGGYAVAALARNDGLGYICFAGSSHSMGLHSALLASVLGPLSPTRADEPSRGAAMSPDPARFVGCYERASARIHVEARGGALSVRTESVDEDWAGGELYRSGLAPAYDIRFTGPATAVSRLPVAAGVPARLRFLEPDPAGRFDLLYLENRLARRTGSVAV